MSRDMTEHIAGQPILETVPQYLYEKLTRRTLQDCFAL